MSAEELDIPVEVSEEQIPDVEEVGPSALGKTPAIGSVRRDNDIPVLRDEVPNLMEEL